LNQVLSTTLGKKIIDKKNWNFAIGGKGLAFVGGEKGASGED